MLGTKRFKEAILLLLFRGFLDLCNTLYLWCLGGLGWGGGLLAGAGSFLDFVLGCAFDSAFLACSSPFPQPDAIAMIRPTIKRQDLNIRFPAYQPRFCSQRDYSGSPVLSG